MLVLADNLTFTTRPENNTSDMPTLSPFTIKVAHFFSVSFREVLHGPVHYDQNAVVSQCAKNVLRSLFLINGSKKMSFPVVDCLHCVGQVKYHLALLLVRESHIWTNYRVRDVRENVIQFAAIVA